MGAILILVKLVSALATIVAGVVGVQEIRDRKNSKDRRKASIAILFPGERPVRGQMDVEDARQIIRN